MVRTARPGGSSLARPDDHALGRLVELVCHLDGDQRVVGQLEHDRSDLELHRVEHDLRRLLDDVDLDANRARERGRGEVGRELDVVAGGDDGPGEPVGVVLDHGHGA